MKLTPFAAFLLSALAGAQPLHHEGQHDRYYELKASSLGATQSWIGGQVKPAQDPWAQPAASGAFLSRIQKDGSLAWEKTIGDASIEQLASDPNGGVYAAGQLACNLEQAWAGPAPADYNYNAYLAHIDPQGKLLGWLDLRIQPTDNNTEPELKSGALYSNSQHTYLGLSFQGQLGPLKSSRKSSAAILSCDPQLANPQYYAAPAQDVGAIAQINGKLYAAGRTDITIGSQDRPSISRPILWEMTDPQRPQIIWQGAPAEYTQIQQLGPDGLIFTDNASEQTQRLDLQSLQIEKLPAGIISLAGPMALGYCNGKIPGSEVIGDCDLMLWTRREQKWQPQARLGTSGRDFPGSLVETPEGFVATATTQGRLPGQPPAAQHAQNWLWFRFTQATNLASLGQRQPGELRRQLSAALQNLVYQEEPDYQHTVGFLGEQIITTNPGRLYDSWRRQDLNGQTLQEWRPDLPANTQPPLEPQIFPRLNGSTLFCLNPPGRTAWFQGDTSGNLTNLYCQASYESAYLGLEFNPKRQRRLIIGNLQSGWKTPVSPWGENQNALALTAGPQGGLAAIWESRGKCKVSLYSAAGLPLKSFPLPGGPFQAALGRPDGLRVASDDVLRHLNWNGKSLSTIPLNGLQVRRIKPVGPEIWLLGARREPNGGVYQASWMPLGKPCQSLPLDRNSFCQDAQVTPQGTWIAGEVEEDYVSDVFWGRLKN